MSRLTGLRAARRAQIITATRRAERGQATETISPQQGLVLDAVKTAIGRDGVPPTVRELAAATGLGSSTIAYHLTQLEARGYLRRDAGKPRRLFLTGATPCEHCGGTGRAA